MKEFIQDAPVFSAISAIILSLIIFFVVDGISSNKEIFSAKLIDKHYQAKRTSVGSGVGMTSNGNMAVVSTTEVDPEKFIFVVKLSSGEVVSAKVSPEFYYSVKIGDQLGGYFLKGKYTSINYATGINEQL